jgi:orotate phosphoribosyltransferase
MLTQDDTLKIFKDAGAYLDGHFLLTSGRHSGAYVEKFNVLQHPEACARLCAGIADHFKAAKPDLVVGPATGGIILAYETARALGTRGIFAEREDGKLVLKRGFSIAPHEKVLVVEDIVTTGLSVFELLDTLKVEKEQGRVVGVGYLVDRSLGKAQFGVPQHALMNLDLPTWTAEECPLCKQGVPLTKRGSREVKKP